MCLASSGSPKAGIPPGRSTSRRGRPRSKRILSDGRRHAHDPAGRDAAADAVRAVDAGQPDGARPGRRRPAVRRPAERHRCAVGLHAAAAHEAALRERRLQAGRHRGAAAVQPGQARACRAATRRSTRSARCIENMGKLRHPGLVLRVDDRLQLDAHQHEHACRAAARSSPASTPRCCRTRRRRNSGRSAKRSCGPTSSTSCSGWCRSPRRRTSSWPCIRTIRRCRRFAAWRGSCAASRTTSACSTWCPAR